MKFSEAMQRNVGQRIGRLLLAAFYGVVAASLAFFVLFVLGRLIVIATGSTVTTRAVLGWLVFAGTVSAGILGARSYLKSSTPRPPD